MALLPEPVMPSRVWYRSPPLTPSASDSIALGWSPAGPKGETTSNRCASEGLAMSRVYGRR